MIRIGHQFFGGYEFFREVIYIIADSGCLFPCTTIRQSNFNLRDTSKSMDILENHVLLIESIQKAIVSAKPRIF